MSDKVRIGFKDERATIAVENIHPLKVIPSAMKRTKKYQQIATSVREIGLVEPLIVHPQKSPKGSFLLLDGHIRLEVLKDLGAEVAPCLIAKDDESFTYNKRINRLVTVQEHYMILKAVDRGVSEERIAQALGVNVARIQQKQKLLDGICPEVIEILKNRHFPGGTMSVMRQVQPLRQVDMAELMVAANNFSISYAKALLLATPREQLKAPEKQRPIRGISEDERARMEREMEKLQRDMKAVEEDYGTNVVRLVVANGYVTRLIDNTHVVSYLQRHHDELLTQLERISETLAAEAEGPADTTA